MSKQVRDHLRSNVVGYVAVFLALSMGTAYATHPGGANTISSADIINEEVKADDIKDGTVTNAELRANSVTTGKIGDGEVRSADVLDDTLGGGLSAADLDPGSVASSELAINAIPADGGIDDGSSKLATDSVDFEELQFNSVRSLTVQNESLTGSDIDDGSIGAADLSANALGARAYGRVAANGTLTRSKNVDSVTHPLPGQYCIDPASGIDAGTAVLVVGQDFSGSGFTGGVFVELPIILWSSGAGPFEPVCPEGTLEVTTLLYDGDGTDDDDGGGNTAGDAFEVSDEPFAFIIP